MSDQPHDGHEQQQEGRPGGRPRPTLPTFSSPPRRTTAAATAQQMPTAAPIYLPPSSTSAVPVSSPPSSSIAGAEGTATTAVAAATRARLSMMDSAVPYGAYQQQHQQHQQQQHPADEMSRADLAAMMYAASSSAPSSSSSVLAGGAVNVGGSSQLPVLYPGMQSQHPQYNQRMQADGTAVSQPTAADMQAALLTALSGGQATSVPSSVPPQPQLEQHGGVTSIPAATADSYTTAISLASPTRLQQNMLAQQTSPATSGHTVYLQSPGTSTYVTSPQSRAAAAAVHTPNSSSPSSQHLLFQQVMHNGMRRACLSQLYKPAQPAQSSPPPSSTQQQQQQQQQVQQQQQPQQQQQQQQQPQMPQQQQQIPQPYSGNGTPRAKRALLSDQTSATASPTTAGVTPVGRPPLRSCNCGKSRCLKLYCECYAAGTYCGPQCKCTNCQNNLENEGRRQLAVLSTLDKNPDAFRPKIKQETTTNRKANHLRGCKCTKSKCLQRYCECFQAGVPCTNNCKCKNCCNRPNSDAFQLAQSQRASADSAQRLGDTTAVSTRGSQALHAFSQQRFSEICQDLIHVAEESSDPQRAVLS
ncbi:hypothetical protein PTSG_04338 [Salpingoeca rosetta]|uniref:CRC domain-containing protein n=1 Tax=Salpingoeca rosetta (strain ATCC 50818 / BSB-021) TaxID=946362 RepID=F2U894_SALR5|nr:uncharacterized protein PTSG_04338 [Salpingoeca rosetta]EGD72602.1 hypothetical protein PTSG_04338 [Salpingoeca rosetta]|eukprot:XP_004994425.1 hypothetical protein PTSG_04338 [Salpingoeca rosetta]